MYFRKTSCGPSSQESSSGWETLFRLGASEYQSSRKWVYSLPVYYWFHFRSTQLARLISEWICFHHSLETTATFIAKVGGDPIPNVKWTKGKWRQLNQGGRILIHQKGDESKLEIRDTTKTDSGLYRCVAFNKHGEIESNVNLQVDERKKQEKIEGDLRAMLKK